MDDHPVRISHYDPRWRQEFEQIRSGIWQSCQGMVTQVEHIGGTALPGRAGQPIIDVVAGVADARHLEASAAAIEGLYFRRIAPAGWVPEAIRLVKPRRGDPTHQVFLMRLGHPAWRRAIAIRDRLIDDPDASLRWEELRVSLWQSAGGDRAAYEAGKDAARVDW